MLVADNVSDVNVGEVTVAMLILPDPLVIDMLLPAVKVDKTGGFEVLPMSNCPLVGALVDEIKSLPLLGMIAIPFAVTPLVRRKVEFDPVSAMVYVLEAEKVPAPMVGLFVAEEDKIKFPVAYRFEAVNPAVESLWAKVLLFADVE